MRKIIRVIFLFLVSCSIALTNSGCIAALVVDEDGNEYDPDETSQIDYTGTDIYTASDMPVSILYGSNEWRDLWHTVLTEDGQPFTNYHGQCTSYAWYRFKQVYCFDSGARGNGDQNAAEIVNTHPDDFSLSSVPQAGSIFSWRNGREVHVGFVEGYDPNSGIVRISDGNYGTRKNTYVTSSGSTYRADGGFRLNMPVSIRYMNNHSYIMYAVPKRSPSEISACRIGG